MKNVPSFLAKQIVLWTVLVSMVSLKGTVCDPVEQDCHSAKTVITYEVSLLSAFKAVVINPVQWNKNAVAHDLSHWLLGCTWLIQSSRPLHVIFSEAQTFCQFKKKVLRITYPSSEDKPRFI